MKSNIYADKNNFVCEDIFMPDLRELFTKGDILRKLRKRKGLTNLELRARSGVNKSTLSKIENDKGGFTDETIGKIASGLGMTKTELYAYIESPEPRPDAFSMLFDREHAELFQKLQEVFRRSKRRENVLRAVIEQVHRELP